MRARTCALAVLMTLGLAGPAFAQERGDYSLEGATVTEGKSLRFVLTAEEEVKEDTDVLAILSELSGSQEDVRTLERSLTFPAGTRELVIPFGTVDDAEIEEPERVVLQVVIGNFCCAQVVGVINDSDSSSIAFWTGTLPGGFVTTNSTYGPPMVARPEGTAPAVRIPGGSFGGDMEINSPQWINGGRLRFIVRGADRPVFAEYLQSTNTAGFNPSPTPSDFRQYIHGIQWSQDGLRYLASGGFARFRLPDGQITECCVNAGSTGGQPARLQGAAGASSRPGFSQFAVSAFDSNAGTLRELFMVDTAAQRAYSLTPGAVDQPKDPAFSPDGRYLATVVDDGIVVDWVISPTNARTSIGVRRQIVQAGGSGTELGLNFIRDPTWWPGSTDALAKIAFSAELSRGRPGESAVENGPRDIYVATLRDLRHPDTTTIESVKRLPQSTEFDDLEPTWGPAITGALGRSLSSAGGGGYASRLPVRVAPVKGVVRLRTPGADQDELLSSALGVAASTLVDARKGRARLTRTKLPVAGAVFGGGLARIDYFGRGGRGVGLGLAGGSFGRCLTGKGAVVRGLDVRVTRGTIAVRGRTARIKAPRGSTLTVTDRCDGTRVAVERGAVKVGGKRLKAGKSLLVK